MSGFALILWLRYGMIEPCISKSVPNRGSPPAILLRESYRDGDRIRKRTLLNLSDWPAERVEGLRGLLKGGVVIPAGQEAFTVERSLPHGHVAAVLGTLRVIGLGPPAGAEDPREPNRPRDLVLAMIVNRVIAPASISDILGVSGRAMVEAMIAGQTDPVVLAGWRTGGSEPRQKSFARRCGAAWVTTASCSSSIWSRSTPSIGRSRGSTRR